MHNFILSHAALKNTLYKQSPVSFQTFKNTELILHAIALLKDNEVVLKCKIFQLRPIFFVLNYDIFSDHFICIDRIKINNIITKSSSFKSQTVIHKSIYWYINYIHVYACVHLYIYGIFEIDLLRLKSDKNTCMFIQYTRNYFIWNNFILLVF